LEAGLSFKTSSAVGAQIAMGQYLSLIHIYLSKDDCRPPPPTFCQQTHGTPQPSPNFGLARALLHLNAQAYCRPARARNTLRRNI